MTRLVDVGTDGERIVVDVADHPVLASPELVAVWRTGPKGHFEYERTEDGREVVEFGTEGEGLGRVRYEIQEPSALISTEPEHLRPISDFYALVRLA